MTASPAAIETRRDAEAASAHFPALLIEAERIAHTVAAGLHGRRRSGPGETFWQHRPYGFGDPVSAVDWRQSARTSSRLYVRENEWEAAAAVYLWRDGSPSLAYSSVDGTPEKGRRADILATALAMLLSRAGERVGLLGEERPPFQGRTAPERILEALILNADAASAPPPAHPPAGSRVVMLSDFYTDLEEIERSVADLANRGAKGALLQICDPAEEDFPYAGRVEFRDVESAARLILGKADAMAAEYRACFAAHRDALENLALKSGWTFIAHRTDRPAQAALLALYQALGDPKARGI